MGDVDHQQDYFDSINDIKKEGADIVNLEKDHQFENKRNSEDIDCVEICQPLNVSNDTSKALEERKSPEDVLEYFRDGKIVFNCKIDRTKRPIEVSRDGESVVRKNKKQKKGTGSLLSFETNDDV